MTRYYTHLIFNEEEFPKEIREDTLLISFINDLIYKLFFANSEATISQKAIKEPGSIEEYTLFYSNEVIKELLKIYKIKDFSLENIKVKLIDRILKVYIKFSYKNLNIEFPISIELKSIY